MSRQGKITITIDKETKENDISLQDIDAIYLGQLFGYILKKASEDSYIMGNRKKEDYLKDSIALVCEYSGAQIDTASGWNVTALTKPKTAGPFICYDSKKQEFHVNMLYDKDAGIFGDSDHLGYPGITHWMPMPK